MNAFAPFNPGPEVLARMFRFFNTAFTPETIADLDLLLPTDGSDRGIGITVAQRILDRRTTLIPPQFTELEQLDDIQGLGADKAEDLLRYFGLPQAEVFVQTMRKNVLPENFEIFSLTLTMEEAAPYSEDDKAFRSWLASQVLKLSDQEPDEDTRRQVEEQLAQAYVDEYPEAHIASFAYALWFYRFDQDNWGSFEHYRKPIETYLTFANERTTLQFYKGFDNGLLLHRGVVVTDLVVVQNADEGTINVITAQLMD